MAELYRDAGSRLDAACVGALERVTEPERVVTASPPFRTSDELAPTFAVSD
jgi:hypothetical protein